MLSSDLGLVENARRVMKLGIKARSALAEMGVAERSGTG